MAHEASSMAYSACMQLTKSGANLVDHLARVAGLNSLDPYVQIARGFQGHILVERGDVAVGVEMLRASIKALDAAPYRLLIQTLKALLIRELAAASHLPEAIEVCDEALAGIARNGDEGYAPELLHLKASSSAWARRS